MVAVSVARRAALRAFVLDAALVLVFAVIGRANHEQGLSLGGVAETSWPFLAALAAGWLALFAWRAPRRIFPTAVSIWLVTVAGGMLLRSATGQGTAIAFVVVATITLGMFLLGWRALAALVDRIRRPRATRLS